MQDHTKRDDTPPDSTDSVKPQWQPPVLIPLDLVDAEAGLGVGIPDGAGCS